MKKVNSIVKKVSILAFMPTSRVLKHFIFILVILGFFAGANAQSYYDLQWKKISENTQNGVFKSNLPIIYEIQQHAMKENNIKEEIKALKGEFEIINMTEDDTKNNAASTFFSKLSKVESRLKGDDLVLFKVLMNEFLYEYYENNSWEITQRTNSNSQDFSQIEIWSKLDFKKVIFKNFSDLESWNVQMKSIQMEKYKTIFEDTQSLEYFPSLLEFNSARYIEFLGNSELFTPNELKANDEKIRSIYAQLIVQNSGNPKLYFETERVNYECLFEKCDDKINRLRKIYNSPTQGDYKLEIADQVAELLVASNRKNREALDLIADAKRQYPKSKFINNLQNRENAIVNPSLVLHYERETQSNKPIQIVAEAKNVSRFSLTIYEVKEDFANFLQYSRDTYSHPFSSVKKSIVRKENFDLQNLQDFKTYKTAVEIKGLPSGIYMLEYVVENAIRENFWFIATESVLTYAKKVENDSKEDVRKLVSNEDGKAFVNQNLEVLEYIDGQAPRKTILKTNENGNFKVPVSDDTQYFKLFLLKGKNNNFNYFESYQARSPRNLTPNGIQQNVQVFLDRAIYRPGQMVYFKIITTQLNQKVNSVASGISQEVSLYDPNNEKVTSQKFTTNEYGSYNGSFTLPKGRLNGTYSLRVENGNWDGYHSLNVEEYKRPNFEVNFEPITGEYKFGETMEIKGKAMSFSGIPLSNALVTYEIKKKDIRWKYFWWFPQNDANENSILGETRTNDKGEFSVKVELKKEENVKGIQVNNYEVNATITDVNGETQSADTNVAVSSVSHYIETKNLADQFSNENVTVEVHTKNYNGQNISKSFHAKLSKLMEPDRIFRDNFSEQVQDLPKFSKQEFIQKFPHDRYDKQEKKDHWKTEKIVLDRMENPNEKMEQGSGHAVHLGTLEAGRYELELYNVEGKDTVKSVQFFDVWNPNGLQKNQKPFLKAVTKKKELQQGEKGKVYVYSAVPFAIIHVFTQNGKGETKTESFTTRNGVLAYEFEVPKDDEISTLNIQFQLVAYNDIQTESLDFKIVSAKKPLRIETLTFRDKIQPGQKEKWTIKILGNDAEKISAEVLANMYDKSLDQFASNIYRWESLRFMPSLLSSYHLNKGLNALYYHKRIGYLQGFGVSSPSFRWFNSPLYYLTAESTVSTKIKSDALSSAAPSAENNDFNGSRGRIGRSEALPAAAVTVDKLESDADGKTDREDLQNVKLRANLNETAFFYPDLKTDPDGNVAFEFESPEALTTWKLMFLAHTKEARGAVLEKTVVTQKDFSITPNYPRFLREGDMLTFKTKIANLSTTSLSGVAQLEILDALTNENITSKFSINSLQKRFDVGSNGSSTVVSWDLKVPSTHSSILLKVVAKAGEFSDGEQKGIAVLPNRMLVTDALPIFVKEGQTKTFVLENLKNNPSKTLENVSNTLEVSTNPIWEVLFALPSIKEDQNASADVVFNKWFADVIAVEIFKANPKLKSVFDEYQSKGLLQSNLEKNQELKQLLLEETPWVFQSNNEKEQMEKLARVFDANTMRNSIKSDWQDLLKLQNADGGFAWYPGYQSSYTTSLYILKNLGKINKWLNGNTVGDQTNEQQAMIEKLIRYVDGQVNRHYDVDTSVKKNIWTDFVFDYLDSRNYWEKQFPLNKMGLNLKNEVIKKAATAQIKDFTFFGLHRAALLFHDYKLTTLSQKILLYLKETSTNTSTQGTYWKQNLNDWGWYSSKAINHAGCIEAFQNLQSSDVSFIEDMKIWLITQKEVNHWGSSRGTAEVIYTLLNSGKSWTSKESDQVEITWGNQALRPQKQTTGYLKESRKSSVLDPKLATVTIKKQSPGIVQGGLFWQYYEDINTIKSSESYLSITKELFKKIKTENGEVLEKISENAPLKVGDKVTVKMILNSDRNMEYIHIKDMRAAGFEPLNVFSGYEWKNSLGYYQSTKDASTNFYIQYMPKGKYVFEYDLICNTPGRFSNGITTLQNYYAPQMNAHTKGSTVEIFENQ